VLGALSLLLLFGGCRQATPRFLQRWLSEPAWQWSDAHVLERVNAVRAGRSLQPKQWPGGARVAVLLSFDVDNETLALASGKPTIGTLSDGEFGARVGLGRVVNLLDRHAIPATFFVPAMSLKLHPEMAGVIRASGRHEIGVHGWIHEGPSSLSAEAERDLLGRAVDHLTKVTGKRPAGYRAPALDFGPHTLAVLRSLGIEYDSSLMADDRPYELLALGQPTGIVELPVSWILDDFVLLNPRAETQSAPRDVLQVWIDEYDRAYDEGTAFVLILHPHVIGRRSRMVVLEALVDHIEAKGGAWFATLGQGAEYVRQQAGLQAPPASAE
jgi:peptidoglycan/xylan/chitin deacetylase (PgdA/CDA1 family)